VITVLTHSPHLLLLHLLLLRSIKRRNGLDIFLRDCVCLQYCKGSVVALSEDHKPDNPEERARIGKYTQQPFCLRPRLVFLTGCGVLQSGRGGTWRKG